jgi:hypothetical protein
MKLSRTLFALLAVAGTAQAAQLTLYKQPNFSGEALTLHDDSSDLSGAHFEDQVSSVVVGSGRWQVCTQPNFQGNCSVLGPGRYGTLEQDLNHRIESVRELAGYAVNDCGDRGANCGPRYYGQASREERFRGYGNSSRDNGYDNSWRDNGYDNGWRDRQGANDRYGYGERDDRSYDRGYYGR